jgi:serine/threonine protein kinase
MFCTKCGVDYEEGDNFCRNCRAPLRKIADRSDALPNVTLPPRSIAKTPPEAAKFNPLDFIRQPGNTFMAVNLVGGQILAGRYQILGNSPLGVGGMSQVWKVNDTQINHQFALKLLLPDLGNHPLAVEAMRNEAALSLRLNHPNICRLHTFHSEPTTSFLIMELISGRTLLEMIHESPNRRMNLADIILVFEKVASAIDFAHGQDPPILHRDIKPANIMVDNQGQVKVTDFGIACELHNTMTRITGRSSTGTLLYMSPEQLNGERFTVASDIYSLAATLYECLAGHTPFHSGDIKYQIIHKQPPSLIGLGVEISALQEQAILKALSKAPADRFSSCSEFIQHVKESSQININTSVTLAKILEEQFSNIGPLSPLESAGLMIQITKIVSEAHARPIPFIYGDIRPENIVVTNYHDLILLRELKSEQIFSLAECEIQESNRNRHVHREHCPYVSPQIKKGYEPNESDDLFALGVIWHELLTGKNTFDTDLGHRFKRNLVKQKLDEAQIAIITDCLAPDDRNRIDDTNLLLERIGTAYAKKISSLSI